MSTKSTPNVRSPLMTSEIGQTIAQRVLGHGDRLPIELPNSIDELKNWLIEQENHLARESARQGFGLLVLKQELGEGEFSRWLAEHDFKEQRVYEHISIAKMLMAAPANVQPQLMGLGKVKLIELARLPNETMAEVAESGELDELSRLSVRELKEQVRRLKTHQKSMIHDLEAAQRLSGAVSGLGKEHDEKEKNAQFTTDFIRSTALAEDWVERGIKELHALRIELLDYFFHAPQEASPSCPRDAVACHLYTATAGIYSQLRTLLDQLTLDLPESARGGLALVDSRLNEKQIIDILQARQYQVRQADQDRHLREAAAQRTVPRKRGRPKK